jgi:hypothetical protein
MKDERYNGHANYETWATCLWLDNDEGSYRFWREEARDIWRRYQADDDGLHTAKSILAKRLQDEVSEAVPLDGASLYSDLLSAALSEVDWFEIAEGMIDEFHSDEDITPSDSEDQTGDDAK